MSLAGALTSMKILAFQKFLEAWPYDAENNVRVGLGADGRQVILVRRPMGLEQYEMDGRPDGRRIYGKSSLFEVYAARATDGRPTDTPGGFSIGGKDRAELLQEGLLYHQRLRLLALLKDWARVERDTARNLRLCDFLKRHAPQAGDPAQLDAWRREVARINAGARAMLLSQKGQYREALNMARAVVDLSLVLAEESAPKGEMLAAALQDYLQGSLANQSALGTAGESRFVRQHDYWTIQHNGRTACLKATRGLQCLALLVRHPGREFHVTELLARLMETPAATSSIPIIEGDRRVAAGLSDCGAQLDALAKLKCRRRLSELRQDLDEAEQLHNPELATQAREEMNAIAQHLASAIGLGGRDRKSSSEAERARCAITKRIKRAIQRIADAIPDLGQHLADRIKTGYFCSYMPNPDRPVTWKF